MNKENHLNQIIKNLEKSRIEYIDLQIDFEKGLKGFLLKTGLKKIGSEIEIDRFLTVQNNYYSALNDYRKILLNEIKEEKREIGNTDIKLIAKLTIFDELKKLRIKKEQKLRSKGLSGAIRTQLQEYRSISTGFKLGFGLLLIAVFFLLSYYFNDGLFYLRVFVLSSGAIIFLEGAQQRISKKNADKKGKNRYRVFEKFNKKINSISRNIVKNLSRVHAELEEDIWSVRVYEKKTEYRRYILAILLGSIIGVSPMIPEGVQLAIKSSISAIFSRFVWFFLPYSAIRNSFFDFWKTPIAQAKDDFEEMDVGEGSFKLEEHVSRADINDPVLIAAQKKELLNPFIETDNAGIVALESTKNEAKASGKISDSEINNAKDVDLSTENEPKIATQAKAVGVLNSEFEFKTTEK